LEAVAASASDDLPVAPPAVLAGRTPRPDPLSDLRAWRAAVARSGRVAEEAICTDRVLRSLHDDPPASTAELAARLGVSELAAARLRPLPL